MLALKQEFRASSKNLPFHIQPAAPKKGGKIEIITIHTHMANEGLVIAQE